MSDTDERTPYVHRNLAVLEVADEATLDTCYADPELRPQLWMRLGPRLALVDRLGLGAVRERLTTLGHAPLTRSEWSD